MTNLKKVLPTRVIKALKKIKSREQLKKLYKKDYRLFLNSFTVDLKDSSLEQLESSMMFYAHALEKGISHTNFRKEFGLSHLMKLSTCLEIYHLREYDRNKEKYLITLAAIQQYKSAHEERGYDTSFMSKYFNKSVARNIDFADGSFAGITSVYNLEKSNNQEKNLKELVKGRVSVREFCKSPVSRDKIKNAIVIALKTPSACNRQPSRVYLIDNQCKMESVLDLQGGFNGFALPPVLLLVTASTRSFLQPIERNEGFIDGGLFSMSLLYGLEYEGLGACALNAMLSVERENKIREILAIPEDEVFIMFIAVGNFKVKTNVPKSKRVSLDSIFREI
ncbi:nitroreductase family protein [Enterococcus faecalis]|uniref:nitroreductase family protein n=1 Tax=Enterococcus faecalis TaxID=1351 RepID=UPI00115F4533|nr:nitroreductase family protein [Enterococcus faecalis]EGO6036430.1 nitroreductase family protein [Enterococcus faecalis]EHU9649734.1 nitroreductase family protein [Enterococcus faecalis]EIA6407734.1 nitroreductase family protein [Enterococcus faecalis]EIA6415108.1 nitroreductase family protein [Enterococcus faecalis]EIA6916434.1 nitroreductase family protein [Enterococcus faecalis]